MFRKLIFLGLLASSASAQAQDVRATLVKRYAELNSAILKRDAMAAERWVKANLAPGFLYTSKTKLMYDSKGFLQGLKDQMKLTRSIEFSKFDVGKPSVTGNKLAVKLTNDFKGTVFFDKRELTLTDRSESLDTWVKIGSTWKLKLIQQTKADTQAFHKQ